MANDWEAVPALELEDDCSHTPEDAAVHEALAAAFS
jgi:hypothetical protein